MKVERKNEWRPVDTAEPPIHEQVGFNNKAPYVLAVDAQDRMSVGYVRSRYSTGELWWIFAKPIGPPTHWTELPDPPKR